MKRVKRYVSTDVLRMIYNSLILPHFYYCILAWGFNQKRILKLQKKAARLISNAKYNAHTDPLFKALSLLKIKDIFELQCAKFYFKFVNNQLPLYFENFFRRNDDIHRHNTRNRGELHLFHFNNSTTQNCIRFHIPNLINNLPDMIKNKIHTHSLSGFSHYLKSFMIGRYTSQCTIENCYICNR